MEKWNTGIKRERNRDVNREIDIEIERKIHRKTWEIKCGKKWERNRDINRAIDKEINREIDGEIKYGNACICGAEFCASPEVMDETWIVQQHHGPFADHPRRSASRWSLLGSLSHLLMLKVFFLGDNKISHFWWIESHFSIRYVVSEEKRRKNFGSPQCIFWDQIIGCLSCLRTRADVISPVVWSTL